MTNGSTSAAGRVSGTISFYGVREPAMNVTVYVRVQDTSRIDAPASTVAEHVIRSVDIHPGGPPVPFVLEGIPRSPGARHVIRVHADVDGNSVVSRGDYVSTQSYVIDASRPQEPVSIVVRQVE